MSFGEAVKSVFSKYATFSGRARRREFWYFYLFQFVVGLVLYFLGDVSEVFVVIYMLFRLAVVVPSIAVLIRRLHDTGKSGWFYFWFLIPFIGYIIMIMLSLEDSQPGDNKYGPNPKGNTGI